MIANDGMRHWDESAIFLKVAEMSDRFLAMPDEAFTKHVNSGRSRTLELYRASHNDSMFIHSDDLV